MDEKTTIKAKQYFKKDNTDILITEIYIKEYNTTIMIQTDFNELIDEQRTTRLVSTTLKKND